MTTNRTGRLTHIARGTTGDETMYDWNGHVTGQ